MTPARQFAVSPHRYACYGLRIDSELELPEMGPLPCADDSTADADVAIRLGELPPTGESFGERLGPIVWADPRQLFLHVPDVVRLLVREGREITLQPLADAESVRVFLLGSGLGALLMQRGFTVLHGNAVRIGERCLVCVGPSGAGKSTLAAGLRARGHEVLADDVVALDNSACVRPGFPRIKLWRDTIEQLGLVADPLRRIRPKLEKFDVPVDASGATAGCPIGWLCELVPSPGDGVRLLPVPGMERLGLLRSNLYRPRFARALQDPADQLRRLGAITAGARIARVERPRSGFALDALMDVLLAETRPSR